MDCRCQRTLIFSFPSATFHSPPYIISQRCLHSSPNISEHYIKFHLPFVILSFVLSLTYFSDISIDGLQWTLVDFLPMTPVSIFIFTYVYFYLHFYLHFPMLLCFTFISGVLIFFSHIVTDRLLEDLYLFLLGSPARCAKYCNYLCQ